MGAGAGVWGAHWHRVSPAPGSRPWRGDAAERLLGATLDVRDALVMSLPRAACPLGSRDPVMVVRGVHGTTELAGRVLRLAQTGNLQTYAFWFAAGMAVLLVFALG